MTSKLELIWRKSLFGSESCRRVSGWGDCRNLRGGSPQGGGGPKFWKTQSESCSWDRDTQLPFLGPRSDPDHWGHEVQKPKILFYVSLHRREKNFLGGQFFLSRLNRTFFFAFDLVDPKMLADDWGEVRGLHLFWEALSNNGWVLGNFFWGDPPLSYKIKIFSKSDFDKYSQKVTRDFLLLERK